jgi:hypothetical protein
MDAFDPFTLTDEQQHQPSLPHNHNNLEYLDPAEIIAQVLGITDKNKIITALSNANYSISNALDILIDSSVELEITEPKQLCRHFLIGQCYRSDCSFSHDPEMLICKFYLKGSCFKGKECEFSHGDELKLEISKRIELLPTTNKYESAAIVHNNDFPPLSQNSSSSYPVQNFSVDDTIQNAETESTAGLYKKVQKLDLNSNDDFPKLGQESRKTASCVNSSFTYSKSLNTVKIPTVQSSHNNYLEQQYSKQKSSKEKVFDLQWLSTGSNLNSSYMEFRAEAIQAALQRNKLCQQYIYNKLTLEPPKLIYQVIKQQLKN